MLYLIQIIYSHSQTYWTRGTCCHLKWYWFLGWFQLDSLIHNPTGEISNINILSGASKMCYISFKSSILAPKLTELVVHNAILNAIDFWGDSSSTHWFTIRLVRFALLPYYQASKKGVVAHSNCLLLLQIHILPLSQYQPTMSCKNPLESRPWNPGCGMTPAQWHRLESNRIEAYRRKQRRSTFSFSGQQYACPPTAFASMFNLPAPYGPSQQPAPLNQ